MANRFASTAPSGWHRAERPAGVHAPVVVIKKGAQAPFLVCCSIYLLLASAVGKQRLQNFIGAFDGLQIGQNCIAGHHQVNHRARQVRIGRCCHQRQTAGSGIKSGCSWRQPGCHLCRSLGRGTSNLERGCIHLPRSRCQSVASNAHVHLCVLVQPPMFSTEDPLTSGLNSHLERIRAAVGVSHTRICSC